MYSVAAPKPSIISGSARLAPIRLVKSTAGMVATMYASTNIELALPNSSSVS